LPALKIELDAGASKSEKLAAVVQQLNNKFGGQAEAATKGMGSFTQMNNAISDLFEIIGGKLFPIIAPVTKAITDMAYALNDSSNTTTAVGKAFAVLDDSITVTKGIFEAFFEIMKKGFGELYSVVEEPIKAVGDALSYVGKKWGDYLSVAWDYWKDDVKAAGGEVTKIVEESSAKISASLVENEAKRVNETEALRQKDEANIIASNQRKQEIEAQNNVVRLESFNSAKQTELENELALEQMRQDAKKNQSQIYTQQEIELAKSKEEKLRMMQTNQTAFEAAQSKVRLDAAIREGIFKKIMASEQVATLQSTFSQISTNINASESILLKHFRASGGINTLSQVIADESKTRMQYNQHSDSLFTVSCDPGAVSLTAERGVTNIASNNVSIYPDSSLSQKKVVIGYTQTTPTLRELITKQYFDANLPAAVTASNGLTKVVNDIQLGGNLTGFPIINADAVGEGVEVAGIGTSTTLGVFRVDNDSTGLAMRVSSDGKGAYIDVSSANTALEVVGNGNADALVVRGGSTGIAIYGDGTNNATTDPCVYGNASAGTGVLGEPVAI